MDTPRLSNCSIDVYYQWLVQYCIFKSSINAVFFCTHNIQSQMRKQVTWVEHVEVEDKTPTHRLYRDLIHSGMAFGAERWLATLQRLCERFACLMVSGNSTRDLGGGTVVTMLKTLLFYMGNTETN